MRTARDVFSRYCSECHAVSGAVDASSQGIQASAPDLRELWREHGSPLNREELSEFIDGRRDVEAHGSRDMPVWGERLYGNLPDTETVEEMRAGTIELLLDYLDTIQSNRAK